MSIKDEKTQAPQQKPAAGNNPEFAIQRLYVKGLSYEAPNTPEIFQGEWKPEVKLDLNTTTKTLTGDNQKVILKNTATVTAKDKTAFLIEVEYAGIFTIKSFPPDQQKYMLRSFCPNLLFPYAREVI
jgi:preprotein translocase subunit SecB